MVEDKAELLQSLRIGRSDAVPKPTAQRRSRVWIGVVVAFVAVAGSLGLFAIPSSVYQQLAIPPSVYRQFVLPSSVHRQFAFLSSIFQRFDFPFSLHRQQTQVSAVQATPAPLPSVTEPQRPPGLVASGYVVARRKATVSAEVTAKVVEVLVHEGTVVKKGDVLARLDSVLPERDLALARSKADAAEAGIGAIAADLQDAERIMNRNLRLRLSQVVSEADLTRSEARVGVLRAQLKQSQAQFETAKQDAKHAAEVLDQYTIHTPFDGIVVERNAQPGEVISPLSVGGFTRTGICTLVDMDSIEVDVDVNETFIGRVHPGMPASAVLDAYPDWTIPASVIDIVPSANREKGTVKVRIGLKKKDLRILPDMAIKVSFEDLSTATARSAEKFAATN
jgi:RND family efflux transporter MFP subunit